MINNLANALRSRKSLPGIDPLEESKRRVPVFSNDIFKVFLDAGEKIKPYNYIASSSQDAFINFCRGVTTKAWVAEIVDNDRNGNPLSLYVRVEHDLIAEMGLSRAWLESRAIMDAGLFIERARERQDLIDFLLECRRENEEEQHGK